MRFFDKLMIDNWQRLSSIEKNEMLQKIILYFINSNVEIKNIYLKEFRIGSMGCETFQLQINEEVFVFVPGKKRATLGWNDGLQGLSDQCIYAVNQSQSDYDYEKK